MSPVDLVTSEGRVTIGEWSKEKEGDHHSGTHCHQGEVVEGEEELGPPGNVGGKGGRGRRHLVPPNNPSGYSTTANLEVAWERIVLPTGSVLQG